MEDSAYYIDLITKYFSGEASEEQIKILSEWVAESEENRKLFEEYRRSWLALEKTRCNSQIDINREWEIFKQAVKLHEADSATKEIPPDISYDLKKSRLFQLGKIAAVLLLVLISVGVLYFLIFNQREMSFTASAGNTEIELPDGSTVNLVPGSTLNFPEKFDSKARKVRISGEGYFEVKHDSTQPFIVIVENDIRIEVLGTAFYVNTHHNVHQVQVILASGKVAVYYTNLPQRKTLLQPGEKAEISKQKTEIRKSVNEDRNYLAWKTRRIEFDNTKLKDVVSLLNKVYQARVVITNEQIENCTLTATFDGQSLESVLKVVAETLSLSVRQRNGMIEISGRNCK